MNDGLETQTHFKSWALHKFVFLFVYLCIHLFIYFSKDLIKMTCKLHFLTLQILFKSRMNNLRLWTDPCGIPQLRLISHVSYWHTLPDLLICCDFWSVSENLGIRTVHRGHSFGNKRPYVIRWTLWHSREASHLSFITREPQWLQSEVTIPSGASSIPGFIPRGQLRPSQVFQSQSREQKSLQCVECLAVCWSRPPVPPQSTPIDPSAYRPAENRSDWRFLGWIGEISGLPL